MYAAARAGDQLDAAFATLKLLSTRLAALSGMAHAPSSCSSSTPGLIIDTQVSGGNQRCVGDDEKANTRAAAPAQPHTVYWQHSWIARTLQQLQLLLLLV